MPVSDSARTSPYQNNYVHFSWCSALELSNYDFIVTLVVPQPVVGHVFGAGL
jgi:hypothetical protein